MKPRGPLHLQRHNFNTTIRGEHCNNQKVTLYRICGDERQRIYLFKMKSYIKSTRTKNLKNTRLQKYKYRHTIQYNNTIIQVCLSVAKNNTIEFNSVCEYCPGYCALAVRSLFVGECIPIPNIIFTPAPLC